MLQVLTIAAILAAAYVLAKVFFVVVMSLLGLVAWAVGRSLETHPSVPHEVVPNVAVLHKCRCGQVGFVPRSSGGVYCRRCFYGAIEHHHVALLADVDFHTVDPRLAMAVLAAMGQYAPRGAVRNVEEKLALGEIAGATA